ncbi:MAG: DUF2079 domain-containing protein [Candidatus Eremiobacteraeota bacterium]|nr:DUF2079 domain-containing protein [Candidatus Eremiobacteraeota bacterium]
MKIVAAAAALFAGLYFALDLNKLHALYYGFDNGIFLQTLSHFGHDASAFNWAEGKSHWFVHDSWLLLVLVPFVKVYPYQETLIAAQVLLIAGSGVALYAFARGIGVERIAATCLALAYLISPAVQGFAYNDFSESHFEPLLIFLFAIAVSRRSLVWILIVTQLMLGIKEDLALFLLWFGVAGAIWYDRRAGLVVAALALVNAIAYQAFLLANGQHGSVPQYSLSVHHLPQDLAFIIEMLVPFAFAPLLLRWRILLALPLVAELTLAERTGFPLARAGTHYTEAFVALLAIGAAIVMREKPALARWALAGSAAMALFFNTTVLHFGRHLYVVDRPAYDAARELVAPQRAITFSAEEQGAWSVAAGDLQARITGFGQPLHVQKPAWNTK